MTACIALQSCDKYILDKLNSYISPNKKLNHYKNSYKWTVNDNKICSDLQKYGIKEDKSHIDYVYPSIDEQYDKDFIRGYFDGDGCITIKSTGYPVTSFVCNSKLFLESLRNVILKYNIECSDIKCNKGKLNNFYTLYIYKISEQIKFSNFIYNNANLYLIRKREKFMKISC